MVTHSMRLGLCGIGLDAYWTQFPGLRERLNGYVSTVASRLERPGIEVINFGLIDTAARSREAGHECRRNDVDVLFVYVTTYALSDTVLPLVTRAGVPVVLLNLQPETAIDYDSFNRLGDRTSMTGEWLAFCSACPMPEIANLFSRSGIPFHQVTGFLDDAETWNEIEEWLDAARVRSILSESTLGLMGHYYSGMLDIMTDVSLLSIAFGTHVKLLEVDELSSLRADINKADIARRIDEFRSAFEIEPDCPEEELRRAARTSIGLDRFVARHDLDLLAYYYKGTGNLANQDTMSSIILGTSLLTAQHIPVAGEYEVKNAIAMKILDLLGAGGSFSEYYAIDFSEDLVLMGHDGPGHIAIAEGKAKVRPLSVYHGKVGRGLSIEMTVKHGPVTLLSIAEDHDSRFKLVVAEGESVAGPILEIGNTNSRYRFPLGARRFVEAWNSQGPAHHCAIGIGHVGTTLEKTAKLFGLGFSKVC